MTTTTPTRPDVDSDIAYRTIDSPFGPLLLAATPDGLVRVAFEREGHDAVLADLAAADQPRVLRSPARLDDAARQLDEYFAGQRRALRAARRPAAGPRVPARRCSTTCEHPYGATESYAGVAAAAGIPGAVRAVGTRLRHNPVPLVVPCHRVVRSDGTIGEYLGGAEAKAALLAMEAAA